MKSAILACLAVSLCTLCLPVTSTAQDCPISATNFQLVGRGASGTTLVYSFDLRSPSEQLVAARLEMLHEHRRIATLDVPSFIARASPASQATTAIRFSSRAPVDQLQVSASEVGKNTTFSPCVSQAVDAARGDDNPTTTVFSDPFDTEAMESNIAEPDAAPFVTEVEFVKKVRPEFPAAALAVGAQGPAIVVITVGTEGRVTHAKILQSSGNAALDQAAKNAARASIFTPARRYGQAQARQYQIEYMFMIENEPVDVATNCNATIEKAQWDGSDRSGSTSLYDITLVSDTDSIQQANIQMNRGEASDVSVLLSPLVWSKTQTGKYLADSQFLDDGPPARVLALQSVRSGQKDATLCGLVPIVVANNTDSEFPEAIGIASIAIKPNHQTMLDPVKIAVRVWPTFSVLHPSPELVAVTTLVITIPKNETHPSSVKMFKSSGMDWFDEAAIAAARATTYVPSGQTAAYKIEFAYNPSPPGRPPHP